MKKICAEKWLTYSKGDLMSYKKLKYLLVSVIFVVFLVIAFSIYYITIKEDSKNEAKLGGEENKSNLIKNSFRCSGFETFSRNNKLIVLSPQTSFSFEDINYSDTNIHSSSLILFNSQKIYRAYFVTKNGKGTYYPANNFDLLSPVDSSTQFLSVKISFPFINYKKENIVPYMNVYMAMKVFYIMNELKNIPRISDAMRTSKNQLKYKRRGWSTLDISPHLIGLASDISRYSINDRKFVEDLSPNLSLKFLQHGGRGNMHIHIQDQPGWKKAASTNKVIEISDLIDDKINQNGSVMFELNKIKIFDSLSVSDNRINYLSQNNFNFKYNFEKESMLSFEFYDVFGNKQAELTSGVFKPGIRSILINYDFLPKGVTKVLISCNKKPVSEKLLFKF